MKAIKIINKYKIKKIFDLKIRLLLILILPIALFTLITSKTDIIFGIRSFIVLSGSMGKALPTGSVIYTMKASDLVPFQIITFTSENTTITHRIVQIFSENGIMKYRTLGDANSTFDKDLVLEKNILGKVIFHIPYLGFFIQFLKTPFGFISFIILPALIFVFIELWNIKKEIEKETEKKIMARYYKNV